MVAATKELADDIEKLFVREEIRKQLRRRKFHTEPVVLACCAIPEIPEECWVLKRRNRDDYMAGLFEKDIEVLLVFSSRKKAMQFLKNAGKNPAKYKPVSYIREDMIDFFKDTYRFVVVDDIGLNQDAIPIPIS